MLNDKVFRAILRTTATQKPLTDRFVFKHKLDRDGKIERRKARLVARGFEQKEGIDYNEVFASVAKAQTWRILLGLAAIYDWPIHQIDAMAAYLHGELEERVYMEISSLL